MNSYQFYYYNDTFNTLMQFNISTTESLSNHYEAIGFVITKLRGGEIEDLLGHIYDEELDFILILLFKDSANSTIYLSSEVRNENIINYFFYVYDKPMSDNCISTSQDVRNIAKGVNYNLYHCAKSTQTYILTSSTDDLWECCNAL